MNFNDLFSFLEALQQHNNKDWMDANRTWYLEVRDAYRGWLAQMNITLAAVDPNYFDTPSNKALNRINNNLMFHPNKSVYKDHFGAGLDQVSKQGDFYIHLGVDECFIGGGYWHPSSSILKSIRSAIDYNGEDLKAILAKNSFQKTFGGLIESETLKTAPKGFSQEHPHIDLLRKKSFAVMAPLSREKVLQSDFKDTVVSLYLEMLPFRRYLNQAVTV